jgi:glycosyltransferase involved in cell wall biosynthesis
MPYLSDAIKSVRMQKYRNFEHIFVVSKSEDNTYAYLKNIKYKEKKIFFYNNGNLYDCLNYGIKQSTGEIIFILHSDDMLNNHLVFSKVTKIFKTNTDVIYSNINICQRHNVKKIIRKWKSFKVHNNFWLATNLPPHTSLFIKKKSLEFLNTFLEYDSSYKISSDFDFLIKIFKSNHLKFKFMNKTNIIMRTGGLSSQIRYALNKTYEDFKILKRHFGNYFFFIYIVKIFKKIKQYK